MQNAFKSYVRMRDYCSTPEQIIAMCLAVIKVREWQCGALMVVRARLCSEQCLALSCR
jgi:hypothetical protein